MQAGSKDLNDLRGYESSPINTKDFIYRRNSPISNKKGNGGGGEGRRDRNGNTRYGAFRALVRGEVEGEEEDGCLLTN